MGLHPVLMVGVIDKNEERFEVHYEFRRFKMEAPVFCMWCGPQMQPLPEGAIDLADATLRVEFKLDDLESPPMPYDAPTQVSLSSQANLFAYRGEFSISTEEGEALFHLALPPYHLPQLETIQPSPSYGWACNKRFVLGWLGQLREFSFVFEVVQASTFSDRADQVQTAMRSLRNQDTISPIHISNQEAVELLRKLRTHFDVEELRDLCFTTGIEDEDFSNKLSAFSRELIQYCERRQLTSQLREACKQVRPNISWL